MMVGNRGYVTQNRLDEDQLNNLRISLEQNAWLEPAGPGEYAFRWARYHPPK